MLRDYNSFSDDIKELQSRQLQSQLTTSVEQDRKGQHFRLLDPPTLPSTPSGPKRLKIGAGPIHLVDKHDARNPILVSLTPDRFGLGLDTFDSA